MKATSQGANNGISSETKEYVRFIYPIYRACKNQEGLFASKDHWIEILSSSEAQEPQDTEFCHHHR